MDFCVCADLERGRLLWHEGGPALAAAVFCGRGKGWVPSFKSQHVGASDGQNLSSLPTSDSRAPGTLLLALPRPPTWLHGNRRDQSSGLQQCSPSEVPHPQLYTTDCELVLKHQLFQKHPSLPLTIDLLRSGYLLKGHFE